MPDAPAGITPDDLDPIDEDLARRVLIRARAIAPGILTVAAESELKKDAVAILKAVARRAGEVGSGAVSSKGRNGTTISFRDIKSAFALDDINGLRDIFAGPEVARHGLPRGSFPIARPLEHVWPEGPYS